ncbi:hypothetical protein CPC08DRAFT_118737 [Agrocybe pediades]|nr:hypothetical protein CPC08DRAFT_118737 [Agrocybe pediades]
MERNPRMLCRYDRQLHMLRECQSVHPVGRRRSSLICDYMGAISLYLLLLIYYLTGSTTPVSGQVSNVTYKLYMCFEGTSFQLTWFFIGVRAAHETKHQVHKHAIQENLHTLF